MFEFGGTYGEYLLGKVSCCLLLSTRMRVCVRAHQSECGVVGVAGTYCGFATPCAALQVSRVFPELFSTAVVPPGAARPSMY